MAEERSASRTRQLLLALLEVGGAAVLLRLHSAFFDVHEPLKRLGDHNGGDLVLLGGEESRLFLLGMLLVLPAAVLFADAATRVLGAPARTLLVRAAARPRTTALVCAALAVLIAQLFTSTVLHHAPLTDDESTYVFQARCMLAGSVTAPAPAPAEAFPHAFVVRTGNGRWGGIYWPGQPALIALGMLLGLPHLFQLLCAFGLVYVGARFAADLWGEEAGAVCAALLATSPLLLFGAATLHNAVPTAFLLAVALRATARGWKQGRVRDLVVCGAAFGAALLFRPLDAAALALPSALLLAIGVVKVSEGGAPRGRRLVGLLLAGLAGSVFVACLLLHNRALTGDPLLTGYGLWTLHNHPGESLFGFRHIAGGFDHTTAMAMSKLAVTLARLNAWFLGWPISLGPLVLALVVCRDRALLLLLVAIGLFFAAYFFYITNAVHDLGSIYYLPVLVVIGCVTAKVIVDSRARLVAMGPTASVFPERLAAALIATAFLTFVPSQVVYLSRLADGINLPREAAAKISGGRPTLVFWEYLGQPGNSSFVFYPPLPGPKLDDPIIWAKDLGRDSVARVRAGFPGRQAYRLRWMQNGEARLDRLP